MNRNLLIAVGLAVSGFGYMALQTKGDPEKRTKQPLTTQSKAAQKQQTVGEIKSEIVSAPVGSNNSTLPTSSLSAHEPVHEEVEATTESASEDQTKQENLVDDLKADKELTSVADVTLVECMGRNCTVELEAKGDESVQIKMLLFMADHREKYGPYSKFYESKDNPRVTHFVISQEQL